MSLDVRIRYYRLWVGEEVVGVQQAPPLEMQQISPVFSWWGTGRAGDVLRIGRLMKTRVSSLSPPPPGLHGTALASVKAPEHRQATPGKAACHLITQKKAIIQARQETCGSLFLARKAFAHTAEPECEKVRYPSSIRAQCQDAETELRRLKVT